MYDDATFSTSGTWCLFVLESRERGHSLVVKCLPSKQNIRVRFPVPAPKDTYYNHVMIYLHDKRYVACEGGVPPLTREATEELLIQVPDWRLAEDNKSIQREFKFGTFPGAIEFVDIVAKIAESEGHHPDINISYNKVTLMLTTHAIHGLSENDFILAAKVDKVK